MVGQLGKKVNGMANVNKKEWAAFLVGTWGILGVTFAAGTFIYKLIEITETIPMNEVAGFAVMQVITYFLVAIGFFSLFIWSFLKGDFKDIEKVKYKVLEMEEKAQEMERPI